MTEAITLQSVIHIAPGQVSSNLNGELIILNVNTGHYYGLSEVGAHVWQLIQQPQSVETLWQLLLRAYEVPPEQCRHDLLELLQNLHDKQLIRVEKNETAAHA